MIVPFLFTIDEFGRQKPTYLWTVYKFLDFGRKNNCPIITQEKFFGDLNGEFGNHGAKLDSSLRFFEYELPDKVQLEENYKYCITKEEEDFILNRYSSIDDAWNKLLKQRDENLENIIDSKIKKIESDYKEKIDVIFTWVWLPSLDYIAKKNSIQVLFYEFSTIRKPRYNTSLGYFQPCDKYNSYYAKKDFEEFKKYNKLIFDRKELLALFLDTEVLDRLKYLYSIPEYKVGYALGLVDDKFEKAFANMTVEQVVQKLENKYRGNEVLIRPHPQMDKVYEFNFDIDKSNDTSEWISKCETIISNISNVSYESMLYGRKTINIFDGLPSSFGECSNLDYFDEKVYGLEELNFLTFYCYAPYELMFNKEYILWRLSKPSILDVYQYNQKYILSKHNIDYSEINKVKMMDRFMYILEKVHKISKNEVVQLNNYSAWMVKEDYDELISKLNAENKDISDKNDILRNDNKNLWEEIQNKNGLIEQINNEKTDLILENETMREKLYSIYNSRTWKLFEPYRKLKRKIKKEGNNNVS